MATQRPAFARTSTDMAVSDQGTGGDSALDSEKAYKTLATDITCVVDAPPLFDAAKEDHFGEADVLRTAKDVLTHIVHMDDDPTLSPWTFRAFFIGMFGSFPCQSFG